MVELGKYAGAVLGSWGASFALLVLLVAVTLVQARRARLRLDAAEARRAGASQAEVGRAGAKEAGQ